MSFINISITGFNINREIYRHVTLPNRKILILSIILSISLLLRAVNDVILIALDNTMHNMSKDVFALDIALYYTLLEIIPFCTIVYIISHADKSKLSHAITDEERGQSMISSLISPSLFSYSTLSKTPSSFEDISAT